jgi:hypothetical protein
MPERWILKDQKGTALVIALLVMITATVVAIGVNFSTTTEVAISGNQRQYTADFFRADGGLELVKTYFLENFCFPSNLDEEKNVGQDLLDEGRDNSPFVDLGLDLTGTQVKKIFEGNPPRGRGISAQYFQGNYYRSLSMVVDSVTLEEEFCLISPK